ncbi:MAG: hypothetical protein GXO09_02245 [Crenarchaeota archaeon]|nr:hypothetical protein [Thermoproteota archaeon]
MSEYRPRSRDEDIEDLRQVFRAITEFMEDIKDVVKEFIELLGEAFDGSRLGREVGEFYRSLVDSGVPAEEALKMTREFLEKKLEIVSRIGETLNVIRTGLGREAGSAAGVARGERRGGTEG